MANEKYALLDTDFISKMHLICKNPQNKLIDKIMAMPNYIFYCHKQVGMELQRHYISDSSEWFEDRVADRTIELYDDNRILEELTDIYGNAAPAAYMSMLKAACTAYRDRYFEEMFTGLSDLDYSKISREGFLEKLEEESRVSGEGKNLGELKTYVLLQVLNVKLGQQIYVFCSDDKNARSGIISLGKVKCISVLSSFVRLQKEIGFTKEEAEPYFRPYIYRCLGKNQTTFKIRDTSAEGRMKKVPCEQVFEEMFEGKIEEMKTGNLRYVQ